VSSSFGYKLVACALALAATLTPAAAEDTVKVALGQRGNWETAASELGQNAGLFKKRGLELELLYTNGSAETLQAVISGSVDIGIGLGTSAVMGAYAKGAPLRAIGNASAGSSEYWYVPADSPIQTMADAGGKTIAYSTTGSSSHLIVLSLIKANALFARAIATGSPAATFTQVMSGQIDIGWASPPFGLDALGEGKIRIVARGNDLPAFKEQTIRLIVANAGFLEVFRSRGPRSVRRIRQDLAGARPRGARRLLSARPSRSRLHQGPRHRDDRRHRVPLSRAAADGPAARHPVRNPCADQMRAATIRFCAWRSASTTSVTASRPSGSARA
jgi:ABC-type taurine transport system substrate-binding protein